MKKYKQVREVFSERMGDVEDMVSGILSNTQLGETLYDTGNQILWMNISFDLQPIGRVNAQIAVKLTEFGVIQVTGYATEDTFSTYQPLFQRIARQINLDNSVRYELRPAGHNLKMIILEVIICGIIGLIVWFATKKRRTS